MFLFLLSHPSRVAQSLPGARCPAGRRAQPRTGPHRRCRHPRGGGGEKPRSPGVSTAPVTPLAALTRTPPLVLLKKKKKEKKVYTWEGGGVGVAWKEGKPQVGSGSPVIKKQGDLSLPDPAWRSRPASAGAVPPRGDRPARRCVGTARSGRLRLGFAGGAGALGFGFGLVLFFFFWETGLEGEKTFLAGRIRPFLFVFFFFFLCVWCSLLWVWRAGPGCCSRQSAVLFILEICQPGKNADLGGVDWVGFFPFFLSF